MTVSSFSGPVAEFYARFRRGYPDTVVDRLATALGVHAGSRVLDIGCGTGQLTIPLATRTRAAVGVDVEADMLRLARRAARHADAGNVAWLLASDAELGTLEVLTGAHAFDAATIGQALHWMDAPRLFGTLRRLLRPGGGVAVVTNGEPQWLLDTPWSRALKEHLETWLGQPLTARCGTDADAQLRYRGALEAAGFDRFTDIEVVHREVLAFERLLGSVYSAMSPDRLPHGDDRAAFEQRLRATLAPAETFAEDVRVTVLVGRSPDVTYGV